MPKTKVTFEDHGQDFLWFEIDDDNNVVNCGPFQASFWCGLIVMNTEHTLKPGNKLAIRKPTSTEVREINYPITAVEKIKD